MSRGRTKPQFCMNQFYIFLSAFLALVFAASDDDTPQPIRSYRSGRLTIGDYDDRIPEHMLQRTERKPQVQEPMSIKSERKAKWLKPLLVGSCVILGLAVLILSIYPPKDNMSDDTFASLSLWVFALPLGSVVACIIVACTLHLITGLFDKAAGCLRDCKFELIFLFILLVLILFSFAYIKMVKAGRAVGTSHGSMMTVWFGSESTISSVVGDVADNICLMIIIGDYLYICVEWLKKNHLTVLGFALMAVSFYLLYALP